MLRTKDKPVFSGGKGIDWVDWFNRIATGGSGDSSNEFAKWRSKWTKHNIKQMKKYNMWGEN